MVAWPSLGRLRLGFPLGRGRRNRSEHRRKVGKKSLRLLSFSPALPDSRPQRERRRTAPTQAGARAMSSMVVDDDAANVAARQHIVEALVDVIEFVLGGYRLIEQK